MSDFETCRDDLARAVATREATRDTVISTHEAEKRFRRRAERMRRDGERDTARLGSVEAEIEKSVAERRRLVKRARDEDADVIKAVAAFANFTEDTEDAVTRLRDDIPVALFPLRLETRFKKVRGSQRFWVRVFPDDALIDNFQPEISQAEYANTALYWTEIWRGGGTEPARKAAWAALVRSHGAGRAYWLIQEIVPADGLMPPGEPIEGETILVVRTESEVSPAEQEHISDYWTAVWRIGGADSEAAFEVLADKLGEERAREVAETLRPATLNKRKPPPAPEEVARVVYLHITLNESSRVISESDWTRGASVWLLPERLLLLGYKDGAEILRQPGKPIPPRLEIGPDPSASENDQIRADGPDLEIPQAQRWMTDFPTAVDVGMGFDIDLSAEGIQFDENSDQPVFDRLFVLGVRMATDPDVSAQDLARLISNHQRSRKGFAILPQGRATNNTDAQSAGYSWWEDPEESYAHFERLEDEQEVEASDWRDRPDGSWLAGFLGLPRKVLRPSPGYFSTDQREARAINEALWPGTLGYYMEQMMAPVFSDTTRHATRDFFTRFVLGRGTVPLIRIGRQPYGILPATVWSKMSWWQDSLYKQMGDALKLPDPNYLEGLATLIGKAVPLWRNKGAGTAHVGTPGDDPQGTLLDILGLHPTSAEFMSRYSQSFTQYANGQGLSSEPVSEPLAEVADEYIAAGLKVLRDLGWATGGSETWSHIVIPPLLQKVFHKAPIPIPPPLGADALSESDRLRVTREDGDNYIAWLKKAAEVSHDALRRQEGFGESPPRALLYQMLRHALDLGYVTTAFHLRAEARQLKVAEATLDRMEPDFIGIATEGGRESRWTPLYCPDPMITGDASTLVGDYIVRKLVTIDPFLRKQIDALGRLSDVPTARLERAFVEHIDCLSYRLDAWRLGIQAVQLSLLRKETDEGFGAKGVHIGAYGWLENVKPKKETLTPIKLSEKLAEHFVNDDLPTLVESDSNLGHIHAPSPDQAVTAAILRSGHAAYKDEEEDTDLFAVDLSSERVRLAHRVLEGMRNGHPLGALLGYQLERDLHDEPKLFLDSLIYKLRLEFPLAGNKNETTKEQVASITEVEARNVVDGDSFGKHIAATKIEKYPYGLSELPDLDSFIGASGLTATQIGDIIDEHVARMRSIGDAVADLGLAESVYQMVRGNTDRAAGMLDSLSKGSSPPQPEVTATPRSGRALTQRIALHLPGGFQHHDLTGEEPPALARPREMGEPALAQWIANHFPLLSNVFVRVSWSDPDGACNGSIDIALADLGKDPISGRGLSPVDVFYQLGSGGVAEMPGFDALLIDHVVKKAHQGTESEGDAIKLRDDSIFNLEYFPEGVIYPDRTKGLTLFELAPLVRALRGALLGARPLRPSDITLSNEAAPVKDASIIPRRDKAEAVLTALDENVRPDATEFSGDLLSEVGPDVAEEEARDAARDGIDAWLVRYGALARKAQPFGLQSISMTAAMEGRRAPFRALLKLIDEILARWSRKAETYKEVMTEFADLPDTASDQERKALLIRARRIISTSPLDEIPDMISELKQEVEELKEYVFDSHRTELQTLRNDAERLGATLKGLTGQLPKIAEVDLTSVQSELDAIRRQVVSLARSLLAGAKSLKKDVEDRVKRATGALGKSEEQMGHQAHALVAEAAQAILGKSFVVLPEFRLSQDRLTEWNAAWTARADLLTHLTNGPDTTPFPVEDWLSGLSLVRERARHLEMTECLGRALSAENTPKLSPLQFPHRPGLGWLGLRFPETNGDGTPFVLDRETLLYTAIVPSGAEIDASQPDETYCGLLLDEWVEVVPSRFFERAPGTDAQVEPVTKETTGLAFHFNRPDCEPPQTILLATPPQQRGVWTGQDLIDTLHETLDFARLRAVEPEDLIGSTEAPDRSSTGTGEPEDISLGALLPAVLSTVTALPITAALDFSLTLPSVLATLEANTDE